MKKLIPALIILMALAIAACLAFCGPATNIPTEPTTIITEPTTSPIVDPTEPTTLPFVPSPSAPDLSAMARQKLADYTIEFNWIDEVADIIIGYVPDVFMLDTIVKTDELTYVITMTDDIEYRMVLCADGTVAYIEYNFESTTENDLFYVK